MPDGPNPISLTRRELRACAELDGQTTTMLAKVLGITPSAVRKRIGKARKRLTAAGLGDRFTPTAKPRLVA